MQSGHFSPSALQLAYLETKLCAGSGASVASTASDDLSDSDASSTGLVTEAQESALNMERVKVDSASTHLDILVSQSSSRDGAVELNMQTSRRGLSTLTVDAATTLFEVRELIDKEPGPTGMAGDVVAFVRTAWATEKVSAGLWSPLLLGSALIELVDARGFVQLRLIF